MSADPTPTTQSTQPTRPTLQVEDHGAVRLITFDRPEVLNAFDTTLYRAVAAELDAARHDDAVHVVVLTGAGRAFSSGQDLEEMARLAAGETHESGFPVLLDALQAFDKPLVAAVNGAAIGIGFTLLPHCDLVLAADDARFRVPFAPMGVPPEAASSLLFPQVMGAQRAARVLFAAPWLTADEAVNHGIALATVAPDRLLPDAMALAEEIAAHPLVALRAIKSTLLAARNPAVTEARAREDSAFATILGLD